MIYRKTKNPKAFTLGFFMCSAPFYEAIKIRCTKFGAGNETRTRDPDLGKVVLYQLSYSRVVLMEAILAILKTSSSL